MSFQSLKLILMGLLCAALTACASVTPASVYNEAAQEQMARALVGALGTQSYEAVAVQAYAPGHVTLRDEFEHLVYNAASSEFEAVMDPLARAIPNRNSAIDIAIAEDDMVMLRYRITGTQSGNFYGVPATGNNFDIPAVAIYKFADGKIIESWYMADEVGFLRQVGQRLPVRADGQWILPPVGGQSAIAANDLVAQMKANPEDSADYRRKLMVATRRTTPRPPKPFIENYRGGHFHIIDAGEKYHDESLPFMQAFSERLDKIEYMIGNDEVVGIKFRLTAQNTGSMFGLPPTNESMDNWETSFAWFNDKGEWTYAWFFGDDMGMLHQLGGSRDYFVPQIGVVQPSAVTK